jgi:hypothetical protein
VPSLRSRGWFTYKHEVGSAFTAVMVCRDELSNGSVRFSEMSPAQFEIQRAQCAQKKWRQSFKVIGGLTRRPQLDQLVQKQQGGGISPIENLPCC